MRDLLVIYSDDNGRIKFGFNKHPKAISGPANLIQIVVKQLLTQVGSNLFCPNVGSTLLNVIGRGYNPTDETNFKNMLAMVIHEVETKIKADQYSQPLLTPSEQLDSIGIDSIQIDDMEGKIFLDLRIKTKTNNVYMVKL